MRVGALLALLILVFAAAPGMTHEMRPAYLDVRETRSNEFAVAWKVPAQGDMRLGLHARLPKQCLAKAEPMRSIVDGAYLERWTVACAGGLKGRRITVDGLRSTLTDALVRIEYESGDIEVVRLMPDEPSFVAAGVQSSLEVAETYVLLGVDHILSGLDHLLFVLALMLLIRHPWMLVKTITAFTIAHSITLAAASLGYFSLPQKPVEATIALSIAFVASELVKIRPGERRLSESYPWVVAFTFGLLHGFGFAGALKDIGLPQSDVPLSLLTFNLGVEAGQMIFVVAVLIVLRAASALTFIQPTLSRRFGAYAIGTAAMLWLVSRTTGLMA